MSLNLLATGNSSYMIIWIVILFVFIWLFMFRPQNKAQKQKNAMLANMAAGDTVLTTSGFYGTIIDIEDDTVIVEFGNNKNCRIPMQKAAIQEVEKPESATAAVEEKKEKKEKN
jgi:preprotein translocase subunit YajC